MKPSLLTLLLLALPISVPSQQPAPDPIAILSQTIQPSPEGPKRLLIRLANQSGRTIVAYAMVVDHLDGRGAGTSRVIHTSVGASGRLPGTVWEAKSAVSYGPDGRLLEHRPSIDYVLFADGSKWGPDLARQSLKIDGMLEGRRMERARLSHLLREKGPQAVVDDVNRPE